MSQGGEWCEESLHWDYKVSDKSFSLIKNEFFPELYGQVTHVRAALDKAKIFSHCHPYFTLIYRLQPLGYPVRSSGRLSEPSVLKERIKLWRRT